MGISTDAKGKELLDKVKEFRREHERLELVLQARSNDRMDLCLVLLEQ